MTNGLTHPRTYRIPPRVKDLTSWRLLKLPEQVHDPVPPPVWFTLDWDDFRPTTENVQARIRNCFESVDSELGGPMEGPVEWRASAGGYGAHVRITLDADDEPTAAQVFSMREVLADDPYRLRCDVYRFAESLDPLYVRGVLFDAKCFLGQWVPAGEWHKLY